MTTITSLPFGPTTVPVPGFGAMGLNFGFNTNLTLTEAEPVLLRALELGCTFWDTAVIYGAGINEKLLGDFIRKHNCRDKIFLASKCGFNVFEADGKTPNGKFECTNAPEHILEYIDGTIERLGFTPDLYYLHRISPATPLEKSIPALASLRASGKCKYIGLSECSATTLRKAHSIAPIDALQAEYSLFETLHETNDLIATCRDLSIAFVAFSPLGKGWLTGNFPYKTPEEIPEGDFRRTLPKFQGENFYANLRIVKALQGLAEKKGVTAAQVALAWVAAQGMIAIPGTTKVGRLEENWASRNVALTEDDKKELRKLIEENKVVGERYSALHAKLAGN